MSLDIRPAIPMPLRKRGGSHAGRDRLPSALASIAIALGTTAAVMLVTAVGLTLGLN